MKKNVKVLVLNTESSNIWHCDDGSLRLLDKPAKSNGIESPAHLYLVSDEEIKEGDWFIPKCANTNLDGKLMQYKCPIEEELVTVLINGNSLATTINIFDDCKKVIATTEAIPLHPSQEKYSVHGNILPQIPESFVKAYVKANGIDEVQVQYTWNVNKDGGHFMQYRENHRPKLRDDNTVIIHQDRAYSPAEVLVFMNKAFDAGNNWGGIVSRAKTIDDIFNEENL